MLIGFSWLKEGNVVGSFENGSEPSGAKKDGNTPFRTL
jgi:hypothetical protein